MVGAEDYFVQVYIFITCHFLGIVEIYFALLFYDILMHHLHENFKDLRKRPTKILKVFFYLLSIGLLIALPIYTFTFNISYIFKYKYTRDIIVFALSSVIILCLASIFTWLTKKSEGDILLYNLTFPHNKERLPLVFWKIMNYFDIFSFYGE